MSRKIFLTLSTFLLFGLFSFGFAQSADESAPEQPSAAVSPLNVTAIEIKGNKAISSNVIISKLKTKVGVEYRENVLNDDLKRLYLLSFFSDVKIDTEKYKDGIKVIITVVERPIIESISFTGIRQVSIREDKLKKSLKSKEGQYLDYPTLSEDLQTVKSVYEKIGFSKAAAVYRTEINKENGKVKIFFDLTEGSKVKIKEIYFEGNKNFSDWKILRLIKTRKAWLFNPGVLKEDVLKEDMNRIKAFYSKNGYTDASSEYTIQTDPAKPFFFITIKISEGKKYLVGSIKISGNKDIATKEILSRIKETTPDKVFNQDAVKTDVSNIQGLYFDKGYISAQVEEASSVDPATNRVNITYNIIENDITYVNKIKIVGNVKTRDVVIRRELRIKPGDKFDGDKLKRSKERLQNLGFFEDISYDTQETAVSDKKDLVVDVKETKTGAFSFGGGYSTVDQIVGFVEIEQKNFDWRNFPYFTGAGQDLKFRASLGSITNSFDLSFTEPWLFDYPISFGFDGYNREHKKDTDVGYGYDEKITGGDVRLGKEISEYMRVNTAYRFERIEISNIDDAASQDLRDEAGTNNVSSIEASLSYDDRDSVFDPTKGNLLTGSGNFAGGPFGGSKDFWKFYGRASHYFPLIRGSSLEIRARVGAGDSYNDTNKIPIYERFFAGGSNTIRGYRERKVGPVDPASSDPLGGNSMLIGNLEYTYPLFNFLKAAAFFDSGNVWSKLGDIGKGGYKSGFGLGVRIKTPMGPMTLDYGIPLNKEPGSDSKGGGRFHFSMTNNF